MRPSGNPAVLEQRRTRAISLLDAGWQPVDVARELGIDRRSVRRWRAAYRTSGMIALKARPNTGRPPLLSARARKRVEHLLLKGAQAAGFQTDLWTCPRIQALIQKQFGVNYHVDPFLGIKMAHKCPITGSKSSGT